MKLGDTEEAENTIADIEQGQRIYMFDIDLKAGKSGAQNFSIAWYGKEV